MKKRIGWLLLVLTILFSIISCKENVNNGQMNSADQGPERLPGIMRPLK